MAPQVDPESGAVIPPPGQWPVDPQDDQPLQEGRLWVDGCFDFFHHGHAGVMLQSRRLGDELIVGLHSDEDIAANKGPTVMNLEERVAAVDACRFSSLSVPHAPYVTSIPWISHYGCKYVAHGDDITSDADGNDCYRFVKKAGRMKIVPRTPGISTTDLVGRMLLCTKDHFIKNMVDVLEGREGGDGSEAERKAQAESMVQRITDYASAPNGLDPYVEVFDFQPIERRPSSIESGLDPAAPIPKPPPHHDPGKGTFQPVVHGQPPRPGQRIVYIDGGFDLFSSGHIAFLQTVSSTEQNLARTAGDWYTPGATAHRIATTGTDYPPAYLVAGLHSDGEINHHKGINYPIMNLFERLLCVTQCRYIHAIVLSAPAIPTQTFLSALPTGPPHAVYHGHTAAMPAPADPYADAKAMGVFVEAAEHRFADVNPAQIVGRILGRRAEYEERQRRKGVKGVGEEAQRRREEMEEAQRRREELERRGGGV